MYVEFYGANGHQDTIKRFFCVFVLVWPIFLWIFACTSKLRMFAHNVPERRPKRFPGFRFCPVMMKIGSVALQVHKNSATIAVIRDPLFVIFLTGDADASLGYSSQVVFLVCRRNSHDCMRSTTASTKANQTFAHRGWRRPQDFRFDFRQLNDSGYVRCHLHCQGRLHFYVVKKFKDDRVCRSRQGDDFSDLINGQRFRLVFFGIRIELVLILFVTAH
mmetsp:Transcript_48441/g.54907  ORF Transcript_48441/g.54907 Transcript_48441/m.54907 type:complete len:218 (-) Transcript_48441:461-1114(-)